ncbi:MAG TPA: exopolysaccharide biosynthesis protein [Steroidobacteraceae bacterium]|nr:exopolysaccharide biosynthesis protein [Steroidobacteraceae bacterium]HQR48692.1 exopolysaccharide biosynthesis protein [Steroidobacteraceae bacterium]
MTAVQFRNTEVRLSEALAATAAAVRGHVVTLRELLGYVGEQGLLVFSAILALPFLIPVSLPFMSTALGLPMLLIGIAVIAGRLPWLPARLLDHELPSETVQHLLERATRMALRFEHLVKPRLPVLTGSGFVNSLHGVTLVTAVLLLMAPLPFVPLANTLPGIAIILLCLGIAERDGLLLVVGYFVALVSAVYIGSLMWLVVQAGMNFDDVLAEPGAWFSRIFKD